MADQKAFKKRLKALMNRPENQVCSDCPAPKPLWASLIVPPPGAPEGSLPIGAFCCLECSGSHRRMGVHISFVRSINLDSWKEKEVMSMENGGNAKVNAIFEARLAGSGSRKPEIHADMPTRERFIRDKYERRKFYHAGAFQEFEAPPVAAFAPTMATLPPAANSSSSVTAASEAARQRVADRQARGVRRMKSADSGAGDLKAMRAAATPSPDFDDQDSAEGDDQFGGAPLSTRGGGRRSKPAVARSLSSSDVLRNNNLPRAPHSAPLGSGDLLDFMSDPAPSQGGSVVSKDSLHDFFGAVSITADPASSNVERFDRFGSFTSTSAVASSARSDFDNAFADFTVQTTTTTAPTANNNNGIRLPVSRSSSQNAKQPPGRSQSGQVREDIMSLYNNNPNMAPHSFLNNSTNPTPNSFAGNNGHPNPMMMNHHNNNNNNMMLHPLSPQPGFGMTPQQLQQQQLMMQMQYQMMQQQQQQQPSFMMNNAPQFMNPAGIGGSMAPPPTQATKPEKEDPFAAFSVNAFRQ